MPSPVVLFRIKFEKRFLLIIAFIVFNAELSADSEYAIDFVLKRCFVGQRLGIHRVLCYYMQF